MKIHELEGMSLMNRRRLLKILGASAALPLATKLAASDVLLGEAHAAGTTLPMYFIEINLRDQWDHGSMWPGGLPRPCAQKMVAALKTTFFFGPSKMVAVQCAGLTPPAQTVPSASTSSPLMFAGAP